MMTGCIRQIVLPAIISVTPEKIILPVEIVLQSIDISSNNRSNICHTNTGYSMLFDGNYRVNLMLPFAKGSICKYRPICCMMFPTDKEVHHGSVRLHSR